MLKYLQLNDICLEISDPVSLASHLFTSSVRGTEHLVRSFVGLRLFS